jgi:hypothetical protein
VAKKGHSEEQILRALHQAEAAPGVADIGREPCADGVDQYTW